MKVIKDNYNKDCVNEQSYPPYPREFICENCESSLEYEKSDLEMGVLGCMHLRCPCCGYSNMIDGNEGNITLTKDNVEFPTHFFHTSTETGAVDYCNNQTVKEYIHKGIDYFRKNKDEYSWGEHITGNLYLCVRRYEGDECYLVTVSNDFYQTYIPFEEADY